MKFRKFLKHHKINRFDQRGIDTAIQDDYRSRKNRIETAKAIENYQNRNRLVRDFKKVFGIDVLPYNKAVL